MGILRIWRRSRLAKDIDLHTKRSLEGFSPRLLAERVTLTRTGFLSGPDRIPVELAEWHGW
jgi:hypothetical protein